MVQIKTCEDLEKVNSLNSLCFLKIGAPWCGPCKVLNKIIDDVEKEHSDILFLKINVDDCEEDLIDKFGVRNIPVTIVLKGDQIQSKEIGIQTKDQIESRLLCK